MTFDQFVAENARLWKFDLTWLNSPAVHPRAHCEARMAATSATGSRTTGPVAVTSARRMVPLKANGAS